ncbi:DUF6883 domain-containing protein [Phormidesmis priestleyi]
MNLPNGDRAIVPLQKLTGYCPNPNHSKGKHKAKVCKSVLGITIDNVDRLDELIRQAAIVGEVVQEALTSHGQEFKVDWIVPNTNGRVLRTLWIISLDSTDPQLISAFIKPQ